MDKSLSLSFSGVKEGEAGKGGREGGGRGEKGEAVEGREEEGDRKRTGSLLMTV
jgi:hypothetical protein